MSLAPEVSVIIPTYNCSDFIAETLESVANQTFQNFECILIDDLSSDNTKDKINELIQRENSTRCDYILLESILAFVDICIFAKCEVELLLQRRNI